MKTPIEVRKAAARAAVIGAGCGLLVLIVVLIQAGSFESLSPAAALLIPIGAFLGWWEWLYWRALKADHFSRYLAAIAFLVFGVLSYLIQISDLHRAKRYKEEGQSTFGVVTGSFPHDHNHIGYRYCVNGVPYEGRDFAPGSASDFLVGDSIEVHYLRSEPAQSASRYPNDTIESVLIGALMGAWWLSTGFVIGRFHYARHRRFQKWSKESGPADRA